MKPFARAISGGIMGRMIDPQLKENADLWEAELSGERLVCRLCLFGRRHHHEFSGGGCRHAAGLGSAIRDPEMASGDQDAGRSQAGQ